MTGAPSRFRTLIAPNGPRRLAQKQWLGPGFAPRPAAPADGRRETLATRQAADRRSGQSRWPVPPRCLNLPAALPEETGPRIDPVVASSTHRKKLYLLP